MILDEAGKLTGIFTDSDLARLFERRIDAALDEPIGRVAGLLDIVDLVGMLPPETLDVLVDPSTAATT